MEHTNTFDGMTALVTGASSGIGAAAIAFGSRGAHALVHLMPAGILAARAESLLGAQSQIIAYSGEPSI